jgi:ABC-type branched-subunit amino acid transport system ATPase component
VCDSQLLEITDLSHLFGGRQAISDFSLGVEEGELVGLIGPNDAGKTTIFNLVTGVFRIEVERIVFQVQDISVRLTAILLPLQIFGYLCARCAMSLIYSIQTVETVKLNMLFPFGKFLLYTRGLNN